MGSVLINPMYFIAAFAPMHGGTMSDFRDSNSWDKRDSDSRNKPLNADRYFSQTESRGE